MAWIKKPETDGPEQLGIGMTERNALGVICGSSNTGVKSEVKRRIK